MSDRVEMQDLIAMKELADWLGVPVATLRYWRNVGQGPASWKLGRRVVYGRQDVEAWLLRERAASLSGGLDSGGIRD